MSVSIYASRETTNEKLRRLGYTTAPAANERKTIFRAGRRVFEGRAHEVESWLASGAVPEAPPADPAIARGCQVRQPDAPRAVRPSVMSEPARAFYSRLDEAKARGDIVMVVHGSMAYEERQPDREGGRRFTLLKERHHRDGDLNAAKGIMRRSRDAAAVAVEEQP